MANWVEGTFRARGSKDNIKRFIMEGLNAASYLGKEKIKKELYYEDDDSLEFRIERTDIDEDVETLHIAGTNRNFLEIQGHIESYKNEKGDFYIAESFRCAWSIDTDDIVEIAKKYEIDIRVNGYERGMEFEKLLEVSRNGTVKCESFIQYADYVWECPSPLLGG